MQPQIDRQTFEQTLLDTLQQRGVLRSTQECILSKLDEAELVTVRGGGREGLEVWIPGWDDILDAEYRPEFVFDDVALHISAPGPDGLAQSEWRFDIVSRRPLFS